MTNRDTYDWPTGWRGLNGSEAAILRDEIYREINGVHALSGRSFEVIGRSETGEAVVLSVTGWQAPFAVMRLDWPAERGAVKTLFGAVPSSKGPDMRAIDSLAALDGPRA